MLSARPVSDLGEIAVGTDLAAAVIDRVGPEAIGPGQVVVIAHKAISKSEGRLRRLSEVTAGGRAAALAAELDKDPRLVQVILDESRGVIRAAHGVLITETHHGFICANSGVDASNVAGDDHVLMLPVDPDASARRVRRRFAELTGAAPGVVITDSFGRAWRTGQCDVAIGCAGVVPLEDWRGGRDAYGRELRATVIAVADQLAATADLARRKDGRQPVVLIDGAGRHVCGEDGPGVAPLIRAAEQDLFR
ncbi:coenzyme F420-0:L-glutamate ligase [Conexibacter sp. DBS9H8]|uniref:coenzyme F420-0:L-glutamate ligase n=1 Tax=Conexibacter sp. DBS9H8 TaxID=2937801 RepID=UPI00200C9DE0|nr:coenzyme F420-0:L-glutamate ligase [Conexibacter sp. DBS9H8]